MVSQIAQNVGAAISNAVHNTGSYLNEHKVEISKGALVGAVAIIAIFAATYFTGCSDLAIGLGTGLGGAAVGVLAGVGFGMRKSYIKQQETLIARQAETDARQAAIRQVNANIAKAALRKHALTTFDQISGNVDAAVAHKSNVRKGLKYAALIVAGVAVVGSAIAANRTGYLTQETVSKFYTDTLSPLAQKAWDNMSLENAKKLCPSFICKA